MLVDNFSGVDHAIEVTRDDLDLTRTRDQYAAGWRGREAVAYLAERAALEGTDAIQILF